MEAASGRVTLDHRVLRAIFDRYEEALPDIVRFGTETRDEDLIDLDEEMANIIRYRPDPRALPFLVEAARRNSKELPDSLMDAFWRIGAPSVDALLGLYRQAGEEFGQEIAFTLAGSNVRDLRVLKLLVDRLERDPGSAAFDLGVYGDPQAIPALEIALAAAESGEAAPGAAPEIREAIHRLKHPEPETALEPYDIWLDYPEISGPFWMILPAAERRAFLESPSGEYRQQAAGSFEGEELPKETKARLLDMAGSDPEVRVRAACWRALRGEMEDEAIRKPVLARLEDESAPVEERAAILTVAAEADGGDIHRWIHEFYARPETRALALEAMWRTMDRAYGEYMPLHLDDEDMEVRRNAVLGVGCLVVHAAAGRLVRFFDDSDLRADALYAYAMAAPGETTRLRMRQLFGRIEELAGGLSAEEAQLVDTAINARLEAFDLEPLFLAQTADEPKHSQEPATHAAKMGRNEPCPCGSGKKYKKCCGANT